MFQRNLQASVFRILHWLPLAVQRQLNERHSVEKLENVSVVESELVVDGNEPLP